MKSSPVKTALMIISFIGLALTCIPAFLEYAGVITKSAYNNLMIVGMIVWFASAIFWIKPDHHMND